MKGAAAPSNSGLSIVYSWETGGVVVTAPEGYPLTALRLESAAGLFQPSCENLNGSFDLCWPDRVFKLAADGFSSVDFGAILSPETSGTLLLNDLTVNGATVHGGFHVGDGPWLVHSDFSVAEPSSCVALGMGLCVLIGFSRMRGRA
jgi:hypothetical protein